MIVISGKELKKIHMTKNEQAEMLLKLHKFAGGVYVNTKLTWYHIHFDIASQPAFPIKLRKITNSALFEAESGVCDFIQLIYSFKLLRCLILLRYIRHFYPIAQYGIYDINPELFDHS
ncbi:MAG: hypothetical protein HZB41_04875 [Ignavibacteriae bacterium]|nr:hypothetical protein [Ignavibacteriota bacterium]